MITARYPLSHGQQGIWFDQQLRGPTGVYHDWEIFRLNGRLDLSAFRSAIELLVSRHEVLRTRFVTVGGEPFQLVDDRRGGHLRTESAHPEPPREEQISAFLREVVERPLSLEHGPLFLVDLLSLDAEDHVLAFTMHHIITDGWSLRLLLTELSECYAGLLTGREPDLPPPVQYGGFALWQRAELQGTEREALLDYWMEHLRGAPTALYLGPDPAGAAAGRPAEAVEFDLAADVVERLREFARSCGATLFMALLGTFEAVLARASGTGDLLIGVPVVGRTVPEFAQSLGFFANLLAVRADLRDDPTAEALLRRVRAAVLGGFARQDLAFGLLVAEVNPVRAERVHPLVQASFQLVDRSLSRRAFSP